MSPDALQESLEILEAMPSGRDQDAKWDVLRKLYSIVLLPLHDEDGRAAVHHAVLHERWRPAPADIRLIAARVASPVPDAEHCYAEIMCEAQAKGLYAEPDPDCPNAYREGPPPFSHPLLRQVVRFLGGWEMICSGEANMQEGLKKQVASAHASCAAGWLENVAAELPKAIGQRRALYFPKWRPSQMLTFQEVVERPRIDPPRLMIEDNGVARMVGGIGRSIPAPLNGRMAGDLTANDRANVAAELEQVRRKMENADAP